MWADPAGPTPTIIRSKSYQVNAPERLPSRYDHLAGSDRNEATPERKQPAAGKTHVTRAQDHRRHLVSACFPSESRDKTHYPAAITGEPATPTETTHVHKLYVNLAASQTRKRLQGHGLGVRKVVATDRNQSAILHTATGRHLHDLEALFSDLPSSAWHEDLDTPVENLRNLGASSAALLREINIHTRSDLARCGPAAPINKSKTTTTRL